MSTPVTTVTEALTRVVHNWHGRRLEGLDFVLQYNLSDPLPEDISQLYLTFSNGTVVASAGPAPKADVSIAMTAANFLLMVNRQLTAHKAMLTGLMKVTGDMKSAAKLWNRSPHIR